MNVVMNRASSTALASSLATRCNSSSFFSAGRLVVEKSLELGVERKAM